MFLEGLTDDSVINVGELAALMRVSRYTIANYCRAGYVLEFGNLSTAGHLKTWLRANPRPVAGPKTKRNAELSAKLEALA